MQLTEIKTMFDTLNIPTAYYEFPDDAGQACPYLCWYFPMSADMYADNINYCKVNQMIVELFTSEKDFALESSVESLLTSNGLAFSRAEEYLAGQRQWMVTYTTEVLING